MPNWHQTEISASNGDPINSTSAFEHSTHLEAQAYQANRWLFIAMMIVLGWCILAQLPHTIVRMRWTGSIWNGFRLRPPGPNEVIVDAVAGPLGTPNALDKPHPQASPPRRLKHLHLSLPIHTIPFLDLPLPQFLVVIFAMALGLGIAGWCQAAFLTHASRSTLVIMAIMSLTAGFGVKAFGVGTWLQVGYTAVNFLHRWLGRLVVLLATLHVVAYLVVFYKAGGESFCAVGCIDLKSRFSRKGTNGSSRQLSGSGCVWRPAARGVGLYSANSKKVVVGIQVRSPRGYRRT
jgi:ferric-chelate reductase